MMGRRIIGFFLVLLGVLFLLGNFGEGSWRYLYYFFKWSPLLLILFGVALVFQGAVRHLPAWWPILILVVYSLLILLVTVLQPAHVSKEEQGSYQFSTSHLQIERGKLQLKDGASNLLIEAGSFAPPQWFAGSYQGIPMSAKMEEGANQVAIEWKPTKLKRLSWFNASWDSFQSTSVVQLSPQLVWDLELKLGAADAKLDLRQIPTERLQLETGVSDIELYLGDFGLKTQLKLEAGVSNIQLHFPRGVGIRIADRSGLTDHNFSEQGFVKDGNDYVNQGYWQATTQYFIQLEMGVSDVKLYYD